MNICILCRKNYDKPYYNLNSSFTNHSKTTLVTYLEQIIGDLISNDDSSDKVCECCFNLFNELDHLEVKTKEIKNQLIELYNKSNLEGEASLLNRESKIKFEENTSLDSFEHAYNNDKCISDDQDSLKQEVKSELSIIHFSNESELKKKLCNLEKTEKDEEDVKDNDNTNDSDQGCSESVEYDMLSDNVVYNTIKSKSIKITKSSKGRSRSTSTEVKLHECTQCTKKWKTAAELRTHMISHSAERPYICEICGQAYKHKTALDVHVGMHNGINPFTCQYCNKSFTQKGALMRHIPIHTGEKPYQCDLCGRCFTHHTSFNVHQISHTGIKSYKCEVCGLGLISGSHLKRHMRVHTGEKKYSCSYCGRRFAEKYNLHSHEKLHAMGTAGVSRKKYRCTICGNSYDRKHKLEEHLTQNHSKASDLQFLKV